MDDVKIGRKLARAEKPVKLALAFAALTVLASAIAAGTVAAIRHDVSSHQIDPIPTIIRNSVTFPVYYPDQQKLPTGYTLNLNSFGSPQKGVVVYTVTYGLNKKLIFTLQPKPSDNDLHTFYQNQVPLHFTWHTKVGTAIVGVLRQQTFVSLPTTNDNAWILITGPTDVNQNQLKQVIQAIKKG